MARRPRVWDNLSPNTRKRYISTGKRLGQTEAQVRAHYQTGGSMSVYRGHRQRPGVSERTWTLLRAAAVNAKLDEDGDVSQILENLLSKGYSPDWILRRLRQKKESRDEFRSWAKRRRRNENLNDDEGYQPGRRRFQNRDPLADIELFYYH